MTLMSFQGVEFQRGDLAQSFLFCFVFNLKIQVIELVNKIPKNRRVVQAGASNASRFTHCCVTSSKSLILSRAWFSVL